MVAMIRAGKKYPSKKIKKILKKYDYITRVMVFFLPKVYIKKILEEDRPILLCYLDKLKVIGILIFISILFNFIFNSFLPDFSVEGESIR